MSTSPSSQPREMSSVGLSSSASSSAASSVVNSTGAAAASKNHCDKTCACKGERELLYNMIRAHGMQNVTKTHAELIKKGLKERWVAQRFFVKNCEGKWRPAAGKRKRPQTTAEWTEASNKRMKVLSEQLIMYKAQVAEVQLEIELQEVAKQMLQLKAQKDAMAH
jgi:hypothetical protein